MPAANETTATPGESLAAMPLMQIITGFWASKTLAAAVELDLFTRLEGRGVDIAALARMMGSSRLTPGIFSGGSCRREAMSSCCR